MKTHFSKEKFNLNFKKVFFFNFERIMHSIRCEKLRNVILFIDYIKSDHQYFNCYIFYFKFFYFNFIHQNLIYFDFYINFDLYFLLLFAFLLLFF
jgi:hypothetical protein